MLNFRAKTGIRGSAVPVPTQYRPHRSETPGKRCSYYNHPAHLNIKDFALPSVFFAPHHATPRHARENYPPFLEIVMGCFNVSGASGTASNYVAQEHAAEATPTHTPRQTPGRHRAPGTPQRGARHADAAEMRALRSQAQTLHRRAVQELPNPRTDAASALLNSMFNLEADILRMNPSAAQNQLTHLQSQLNNFYRTNPVSPDQFDQSDRFAISGQYDRFSDTASHASDIYQPDDSFRYMGFRPGR
ncbi:hypothetical protein [Ralstonia solanacearum]|nr:hypothetical protein [Ralstonia solanacearum]